MMNREYMKQTYADNLAAWREYRAQIAQYAETLCEIVQNHRFNGGTPEQAAREIVQAIGAENARVIIASAVNAHEGDGRLSAAVIEWAQGIGWDWEMTCNLGLTLDAKMHMCHINQTAEALMNLSEDEPEQPTETEEEQPEEPAEQTTPNGVTYHISENAEYNSREVYFSGKPAAETREALKALKMRWHGVKKCWYGYASEHEIITAIQGAELTANPEQGATVTTDGYMGGGAYYGAKSGRYLYGADLAAAIRADIKAAGIKGVTIRCKTYSGGQSITATVTIERGDLVQGYRIEDQELLHYLNSHGAYDGERWVYYSKELDNPETWADLAAKVSAYEISKYSKAQSINHYHIENYHEIVDAFIAKLQKIRDIITAYRYDDSNSMVDYFDTNFYYDIDTKPGKSWTA